MEIKAGEENGYAIFFDLIHFFFYIRGKEIKYFRNELHKFFTLSFYFSITAIFMILL